MILDEDNNIVYEEEVRLLKLNLQRSHTNLLDYLRTTLGQAELK